MQNLHANFTTLCMHGLGDRPVLLDVPVVHHCATVLHGRTFRVRPYSSGHNQSDATAGALGIETDHSIDTARDIFQTQMYGPHQDPVLQLGKTEIQGFHQRFVLCSHRAIVSYFD